MKALSCPDLAAAADEIMGQAADFPKDVSSEWTDARCSMQASGNAKTAEVPVGGCLLAGDAEASEEEGECELHCAVQHTPFSVENPASGVETCARNVSSHYFP